MKGKNRVQSGWTNKKNFKLVLKIYYFNTQDFVVEDLTARKRRQIYSIIRNLHRNLLIFTCVLTCCHIFAVATLIFSLPMDKYPCPPKKNASIIINRHTIKQKIVIMYI